MSQDDKTRIKESLNSSFEAKLFSYYCSICKKHCFVCDSSLEDLPNRRTDESKVIIKSMFYKIYTNIGDTIYIRRNGGVERQTRLNCKGCGVSVGYYCQENIDDNQHIYVYNQVLT